MSTICEDKFTKVFSEFTDAIIIVDKETGVNYLYVCRGYGGGLTPLLDSDGKPIITKGGYKM